MNSYLRPTAPIAADVLLPADPALAMALAQRLLDKPLMANHHHGLWGYSGRTDSGRALTIQSTGIGGPSLAAVVGELAGHGGRRLIRIGRCTGLDPSLAVGEPALVAGALGADGTSAALGAELTRPDPALAEALATAASGLRSLTVASHDLGVAAGAQTLTAWATQGIEAVDLETAALFARAASLELESAAAVVVTESAAGVAPCEDDAAAALLGLGEVATRALAGAGHAAAVGR